MQYAYINPLPDVPLSVQVKKLENSDKLISEVKKKREELDKLLSLLRQGDVLRVYSIRVFPLSTLELIQMVDGLNKKKVVLDSCSEHITDQSLFSLLEYYQRDFRQRLSKVAIEARRKRGTKGGRHPGLSEEAKIKARNAAKLYNAKTPVKEILKSLGIGSKTTLYKYLRHEGIQIGNYPNQGEFIGNLDDESPAEYKRKNH